MRLKNTSGATLATAAAILFGAGFVSTSFAASEAKVQCTGVNACKGQSACKSANNACKGQNSCKGKGFLEMTPEECKDAQQKIRDLLLGKYRTLSPERRAGSVPARRFNSWNQAALLGEW